MPALDDESITDPDDGSKTKKLPKTKKPKKTDPKLDRAAKKAAKEGDRAAKKAAKAEKRKARKESMSPVTGILVFLVIAFVAGNVAGFFLYGHPRIITCLAFGFMFMGATGLVIALVALVKNAAKAVAEGIDS